MAEKVCYFAHHTTDYNTERERAAVELIASSGYYVMNPDSPENEAAYQERGMQYFVEMVQRCDAVAFQRFPGGEIGAGVGREIQAAATDGKPIYEISDNSLTEIDAPTVEEFILTVDATKALLKAIRVARTASAD